MSDQESIIDDGEVTSEDSFFNKERRFRLIKFSLVSAVGLGIDYLIVFLMLLLFDHYFVDDVFFKVWFLNVSKVLVSQAIAIVIVMLYNYIINKLWTFRKQEKETEFNTITQFIKFAVVGASGTIINLGLVYLFYDVIRWNEYIAVTIGFIVSVITNFILNDIWTFNPKFGKNINDEQLEN